MRALTRMLLLLLVTFGLALPMADGFGSRGGAEAAPRPCPSKVLIRACLAETPSDAIAPRGTASVDGSCQGKAIGAEPSPLAVPTVCGASAFDVVSASWSAWNPPTPARPPRS